MGGTHRGDFLVGPRTATVKAASGGLRPLCMDSARRTKCNSVRTRRAAPQDRPTYAFRCRWTTSRRPNSGQRIDPIAVRRQRRWQAVCRGVWRKCRRGRRRRAFCQRPAAAYVSVKYSSCLCKLLPAAHPPSSGVPLAADRRRVRQRRRGGAGTARKTPPLRGAATAADGPSAAAWRTRAQACAAWIAGKPDFPAKAV